MKDPRLDETDRAIVRGLLFGRWRFDVPAREMSADRIVDIAARTRRLEPHVVRFRCGPDVSRQAMREDLLALLAGPAPAA